MDTEAVAGKEEVAAEVGEDTMVGEETIMGSSVGMTETKTGTGTGGIEVGISQGLQAPTMGTTPIIRDHIMTDTDFYTKLLRFCQYLKHSQSMTCIAVNVWRCATEVFNTPGS